MTESELREGVVIPLLRTMGYRHIFLQHGGSPEKGKDIVCHRVDSLGDQRHLAVVVKKTDIHGTVGKSGSASEVLYQLNQVLDEPYTDVYSLRPVEISECWVITSGRIVNTAVESILGQLRHTGLSRLVRFIDGPRLCELVQDFLPRFWEKDFPLLQMGHELATIVDGVLSKTALLKRVSEPEMTGELLDGIESDLLMVEMLRQNVLLYARLAEDRNAVGIRIAPVASVKEDIIFPVVRLLSRQATGHGVQVTVQASALRESVRTDDNLLKLVLYNLLNNAIQYSHRRSSIVVEAGLDHERDVGPRLWFVVSNVGIGIPEDETGRVFQAGYRASNAASVSMRGTGHGLYVARGVTESLGGELTLVSGARDPERTSFKAVIPVGPRTP